MAVFKCKMCGGTINFAEGATVGVCENCGTRQTLPKLDNEKRANLYDRANHFRRNNDFDKAMSIYEQILNEDGTDAEAYWSIVLCRYGIEYVVDPATKRRVPTVNRAQYTSIFADEDYKSAIQYADISQRAIYEAEAKAIDEIQKGILAISQREEPFDVFICYKETDESGRRTQDSVLANDLYHQLTQEGFKVFFSRITLEDKLGTAYEPYIFAALNSAKVMVVLGTKPEFFNAVWVRNEWSRYLALIKNGAKKMLVPAYRDMDPYDLPEEFSHLQAQDMSKLGFMQDLIRGIKKIIGSEVQKPISRETVVVNSGPINVATMIKRAFLFLEDGDWEKADEFCEQVLNQDPENANAYLCKLMAELQVHKANDLKDLEVPFDEFNNYAKAYRFGSEQLKNSLSSCNKYIRERNESERLNRIYNDAIAEMNDAKTEEEFKSAAEQFTSISDFQDASARATKCLENAEICRKDAIYNFAKSSMVGEKTGPYVTAMNKFKEIPGWRDADEQISICQKRITGIQAKEEMALLAKKKAFEEEKRAEEKATKRAMTMAALILLAIVATVVIYFVAKLIIVPSTKYKKAEKFLEGKNYSQAITLFEELGDYKDASHRIYDVKVAEATDLMEQGDYENAYNLFDKLGDNREEKLQCAYLYASKLEKNNNYESAALYYERASGYKDADEKIKSLYGPLAKQYYEKEDYEKALEYYNKAGLKDKKLFQELYYQQGIRYVNQHLWCLAINNFEGTTLKGYKDSANRLKEAKYRYAIDNYDNNNKTTYKYLKELKASGYKDSAQYYSNLYDWKATIIYCNNDEDDNETKVTSMEKTCSYARFGFELSGGIPGAKETFYAKSWFPGEESYASTWDWEDRKDGGWCCIEWPSGWECNNVGELKVAVIQKSTKKEIGSYTVRITY